MKMRARFEEEKSKRDLQNLERKEALKNNKLQPFKMGTQKVPLFTSYPTAYLEKKVKKEKTQNLEIYKLTKKS